MYLFLEVESGPFSFAPLLIILVAAPLAILAVLVVLRYLRGKRD